MENGRALSEHKYDPTKVRLDGDIISIQEMHTRQTIVPRILKGVSVLKNFGTVNFGAEASAHEPLVLPRTHLWPL